MRKLIYPVFLISLLMIVACGAKGQKKQSKKKTFKNDGPIAADTIEVGNIDKTEEEWKQLLTAEEYHILRERGTEPAFRNKYYDNKEEGIYYCAACGLPIYSSKTKFHSGTGWPSFWAPIDPKLVKTKTDTRLGMERTEVVCAQCGSHLGHIFQWDTVTGVRHCVNSAAFEFKAQEL